jgi:hypothetical protein
VTWRAAVVLTAVVLAACASRHPSPATVQSCVEGADAERRGCLQDCEGGFGEALISCHGGPNACTDKCETSLLGCQAGPMQHLRFCGEAAENPSSCSARLRVDQSQCRGRNDAAACTAEARRRAAACWHACEGTDRPALNRCAEGFTTCLEACVPRQ